MTYSVFELFKIGIGPSSSHTVGPMIAARRFADLLLTSGVLGETGRVAIELFGSLGATGEGHGTITALQLGLLGELPEQVDPQRVPAVLAGIRDSSTLSILGRHTIGFRPDDDIVLQPRKRVGAHSNAMRFSAFGADGTILAERVYFSIGGGFITDDHDAGPESGSRPTIPYPFGSGVDLLRLAAQTGLAISGIARANEDTLRPSAHVRAELLRIWSVMRQCVAQGCATRGVLPGGLHVRRRAADQAAYLAAPSDADPWSAMDHVTTYALAVNEQNAAGGRVVTAPTNGAAGIIPAVLHYYSEFVTGADDDGVVRFLLTAAAIGSIIKENASISGAEVGCQGEVGSACAMAAAGLAEVLGGTPEQVENAAEIGIEHNLGLTCDPVGGLVQIPCIERNAVAAVKAITAARMALRGDGHHRVSLDDAVKTMRETGIDMLDKYKETAQGGLALNVVEC
ncbi:L-serine ammonia-lyase [Mycolicibacterium frederiksbergense]|uniref:L-serine ammonia-lyase n=1 Tax=Mycolicibacterium frederiksbergense TaxID=117567 RepID=UPI00399C0796